ncbi:MAG: type II CRISPR RNA-guided endonuclease Cas9 [Chitinophagales bacterium]|nr:type II CRISPR RNA-guided endonuclease Cas9 [Chitinophagales bacterium]
MSRILGLDIGSNSIGWAVVDTAAKKIEGMGVRIFPMGVNLEKGSKEEAKNATRRAKRQLRKQGFRKKLRKQLLAKVLIPVGMFPNIEDLYHKLPDNERPKKAAANFDEKFKTVINRIQLQEELRTFFAINPYEARAKAYRGEQLSLPEIGRVLYQFSQHRGYKSNLKTNSDDEGTIFEGKPKEGKIGINETKERAKQYGTLGNYLYTLVNTENRKAMPLLERARNRYTLREMYKDEFELIWNSQAHFYPEVLTDTLKQAIGNPLKDEGILFFQRPLRSQRHLIGKCTFEPSKRRCPLSAIAFEWYRIYSDVNRIYNGEHQLTLDQREQLIELFLSKEKVEFKEIIKKLNIAGANYNYKPEDKFPGAKTIRNFRAIFGKERWDAFTENEQEEIWHIKYTAQDAEWLKAYAREKWKLNDEQIKKLLAFRLADDYASLSLKAINSILPFLKMGLPLDKAVLWGGIRNAFGHEVFDSMEADEKAALMDGIEAITSSSKGRVTDRLQQFLREKYHFSEKQLNKLYHHSEKEVKQDADELGDPPAARNPIVQQSLHEIRKLIKQLNKDFGRPHEIRVELARELKSSKKHREKTRQQQQENENRNDEIKRRLDEYNLRHTRNNIQRVQLWDECGHICPFSGTEIGFTQLFNDGYVQVEHIIPYSISLNDSLGNKTLCIAPKNLLKGKLTPYQAFGNNEQEWNAIKEMAKKAFAGNYPKYLRFISKDNPDFDNFVSRQLNDTRYTARLTKEYLSQLKDTKVQITQGGVTSLLRHYWGLDGILSQTYPALEYNDGEYLAAIDQDGGIIELRKWMADNNEKNREQLEKLGQVLEGYINKGIFYPFKNRDDHRHHAIDALSVACCEKRYLHNISTFAAQGLDNEEIRRTYPIETPWNSFWADAKRMVEQIIVSHRQNHKVISVIKKQLFDHNGKPRKNKAGQKLYAKGIAARGQLHKETVYGKRRHPDGETALHIRKSLDEIKDSKHIDKIADEGIRRLVLHHLESLGVDTGQKTFTVPKGAFFTYDEASKKRLPRLFLPNRNGPPIPVLKVRMRETSSGEVQLKAANQWVKPGNNHHVLIYKDEQGQLQERVVTFWEAVERVKQGLPAIEVDMKHGHTFVASLQENDMFLLGLSDEELEHQRYNQPKLSDHLYRVQKISSMYYTFRHHLASTLKNPNQEFSIRSMKGWVAANPVKTTISKTGKIVLKEKTPNAKH